MNNDPLHEQSPEELCRSSVRKGGNKSRGWEQGCPSHIKPDQVYHHPQEQQKQRTTRRTRVVSAQKRRTRPQILSEPKAGGQRRWAREHPYISHTGLCHHSTPQQPRDCVCPVEMEHFSKAISPSTSTYPRWALEEGWRPEEVWSTAAARSPDTAMPTSPPGMCKGPWGQAGQHRNSPGWCYTKNICGLRQLKQFRGWDSIQHLALPGQHPPPSGEGSKGTAAQDLHLQGEERSPSKPSPACRSCI